MKRVLDIGLTHKSVLSVFRSSLQLDMAREQRSRWMAHKMSVACTRINDELCSLLGNEKETDVFHSRLDKPDGTSFHQITDKTYVVTPTVLETDRLVPAGLPFQQQDHQMSTHNLRWHDSRAVSEELPLRTQSHLVV